MNMYGGWGRDKLNLRFPVPCYSANWFTNIGCLVVVVVGAQ